MAPVIYGGCQIGIHTGKRWLSERISMPQGLQLIIFVPDFIGKTSTARGVLDDMVSRSDCSFNIGRVAFLINALNQGNVENLKFGVQDGIHQPQRGSKLYPYLFPMMEAAEAAGASGCYLSGAGPTVLAFTSGSSGDIFVQSQSERTDLAVAQSMRDAAKKAGVEGKCYVAQVSQVGAHVVSVSPKFSTEEVVYMGGDTANGGVL